MAGLCGWSCGARALEISDEVIGGMASAIRRFDDAQVVSRSAPFGSAAVAGSAADLFQSASQLVAVWGAVRFEDSRLRDLAAREGTARAMADAYSRSGTDLLRKLNGSFAVAIIDG